MLSFNPFGEMQQQVTAQSRTSAAMTQRPVQSKNAMERTATAMGPKVTQQLSEIVSPKPQRALPPLPKGKEEASQVKVVKTEKPLQLQNLILYKPIEIRTHLREYGINIEPEGLNRLIQGLSEEKNKPDINYNMKKTLASLVNTEVGREYVNQLAFNERSFERTCNYFASTAKTAAEIISAVANMEEGGPNQEVVILGNYMVNKKELSNLALGLAKIIFNNKKAQEHYFTNNF